MASDNELELNLGGWRSINEARFLAERLRRTLEEYVFQGEEVLPGGNLTISLGLATFPSNAKTPTELIERADRALYHAKKHGRNRVSVSRERVALV